MDTGQSGERLCKVVSIASDGKVRLPKEAVEELGIAGRRAKAAIYIADRGISKDLIIRVLEVVK